MKTSLQATLLATSVLAVSVLAKDPNLPPPEMKLKEEWATLEKKNFDDWKIDQFVGWGKAADGGSTGFEFLTDKGIDFDVLVANREYWTDADKKAKRQVIYLIESGRFYLLDPASKQEKHLLQILTDAANTQKGKGRVDPKYIRALIDKIKDRKPRGEYWPMTKEEVDEANKRAEQAADDQLPARVELKAE